MKMNGKYQFFNCNALALSILFAAFLFVALCCQTVYGQTARMKERLEIIIAKNEEFRERTGTEHYKDYLQFDEDLIEIITNGDEYYAELYAILTNAETSKPVAEVAVAGLQCLNDFNYKRMLYRALKDYKAGGIKGLSEYNFDLILSNGVGNWGYRNEFSMYEPDFEEYFDAVLADPGVSENIKKMVNSMREGWAISYYHTMVNESPSYRPSSIECIAITEDRVMAVYPEYIRRYWLKNR